MNKSAGPAHVVGVYRMLYGSDFVGESLESVYDHCDEIFCFVTREIFGGRRSVRYAGRDVYVPHDIDGLTDAIDLWRATNDRDRKVRIVENPFGGMLGGLVSRLVNDVVLPETGATHVLFVEPDEVWRADRIERLMDCARQRWDEGFVDEEFMTACDLFWRTPLFCTTRHNPYAALRSLAPGGEMGETAEALAEKGGGVRRVERPFIRAHNFGYAASERTVFWKHMAALSFSRDLGLDSPPREGWFEDVWRAWDWETNRREDLCPSEGYERNFPPAQPYPEAELPAPIRRRLRERPLAEWGARRGAPRAGITQGAA